MLQRYNHKLANNICWNLLLLTVGGLLVAICVQCVALPHDFLAGGMMGLALLLTYLSDSLPPLVLYAILCAPIYLLGWFAVGRLFLLYTIYGTAVTSFLGMLINFQIPVKNELYAAILGGVIHGAGLGIMLRSLGSSGGTDIIAILLKNKWNIPIGQFNFLFNALLFLCGSFRLSLDIIIASLIMIFISSQTLEYVVGMFNRRKLVLIISQCGEIIGEAILASEKFGATMIRSKGLYSGTDREILLSVTNNVALKRLETIVFSIDPKALFIVENTFYVSGGQFAKPR